MVEIQKSKCHHLISTKLHCAPPRCMSVQNYIVNHDLYVGCEPPNGSSLCPCPPKYSVPWPDAVAEFVVVGQAAGPWFVCRLWTTKWLFSVLRTTWVCSLWTHLGNCSNSLQFVEQTSKRVRTTKEWKMLGVIPTSQKSRPPLCTMVHIMSYHGAQCRLMVHNAGQWCTT